MNMWANTANVVEHGQISNTFPEQNTSEERLKYQDKRPYKALRANIAEKKKIKDTQTLFFKVALMLMNRKKKSRLLFVFFTSPAVLPFYYHIDSSFNF